MKFKVGDVVYWKSIQREYPNEIDEDFVRTIVEVRGGEYVINKYDWPIPRTFTADYVEGHYDWLEILNSPLYKALA